MSLCCPNCFENQTAKDFIVEHGEAGDCDYCCSEDVATIDPCELDSMFEEVLQLYEPALQDVHYTNHGHGDFYMESLQELIDDDWQIFSDNVTPERKNDLLDEIRLGDLSPEERSMNTLSEDWWASVESAFHSSTAEDDWEVFAHYIKLSRRFVFDDNNLALIDPRSWVGDILESQHAIRTVGPETALYRGRMGFVETGPPQGLRIPYPAEEMGAPPAHLAGGGRAHAEKIPVFYAAFEESTALYESGRFPGAIVSVREVRATEELRIADLTQFHGVADPLDATDLAQRLHHYGLLNQLNQELSRPVHPSESAVEYVPTQYIAEAI